MSKMDDKKGSQVFSSEDFFKNFFNSPAGSLSSTAGFFEFIADKLPYLIGFVDKNQIYRYVNKAYEEWYNLPAEKITGHSIKELLGSRTYLNIADKVEKALAGEIVQYEDYMYFSKDKVKPFHANYFPYKNNDGKIEGFFVLIEDLSEKTGLLESVSKHESDLTERVKELKCLYSITRLSEKDLPLEDFLEEIIEILPPSWQYPEIACAELTLDDKNYKCSKYKDSKWFQSADIYVAGRKAGHVSILYGEEKPEAYEGPFLREERQLIDAVAEKIGKYVHRKQLEEKIKDNRKLIRTLLDASPEAELLLNTAGEIESANRTFVKNIKKNAKTTAGKNYFDLLPDDLAMIRKPVFDEVLNTGHAQNIHDSFDGKFYHTYMTPVTDNNDNIRKVAIFTRDITKELQSRAAFKNIVENSQQGIIILNDKKITFANEQASVITGYSIKDLENPDNKLRAELVHPDDRKTFNKIFKDCLNERMNREEFQIRLNRRNDVPVWVRASVSVMEFFGEKSVLFTIVDITSQKNAEEAREESEKLYRNLFEHASELIFITDDEGRYTDVNPAAAEFLGYTIEELLEKSVFDLSPEGSYEEGIKYWKEFIKEGEQSGMYPLKKKDGSIAVLEYFAVANICPGRHLSILRDKTETINAEERLRKNLELLDAAGQVTKLGGWEVDIASRKAIWTKATREIHEVPDDFVPDVEKGINFFPGESRAIITKAIEELIENKTEYDIELEFVSAKGNKKWVHATGRAEIKDEKVVRIWGTFQDVTERKEAEKLLAESEKKYRELFELAQEGIWLIDENAFTTLVNPRMEELLGYGPGEMNGKHLFDFMDENEKKSAIEKLSDREAGNLEVHEFTFLKKDGDSITTQLSTTPILNEEGEYEGALAVVIDLSMRIKAENAIRESEYRLRNIIENMPVMLDAFDKNNRPLVWNQECERVTGYKSHEILGRDDLFELLYPDKKYRKNILKAFGKNSDAIRHYETNITCKDGSEKTVAWSNISKHYPIEGWHTWAIGVDVTSAKKAEKERQKLEARIMEAQKNESMALLAGGIAHDFNNILVSILGYADLAFHKISPYSAIKEELVEIITASKRAAELCRQMLAYSGKGRILIKQVNISNLLDETVHLLKVSISKNVILKLNLSGEIPSIEADPTQLRQVFMNLITNASDAIAGKSGIITITTGAMEMDHGYIEEVYGGSNLKPGQYVYLEVSDTGDGIDKEILPRIFDPFFTTKFTGRGLGLAAVKGIIDAHSGGIRIYSEKGKGTSFKIVFPTLPETETEKKSKDTTSDTPKRFEGTVLLVDDDETVRSVGKRMLETLGFKVISASDGVEALDIFKKKKDKITFVILDLTMPKMSGEETFEKMRRMDRDAFILLSSGYSEDEIMSRFAGHDVTDFIEKPYRFDTLREKIGKIIESDKHKNK